jgi:hypothetical protein
MPLSSRKKREKRDDRKKKVVSSRKRGQKRESMSRSHLIIPEGVTLFTPKEEGDYKFEVIPYVVTAANPMVDEDDVGGLHFERTYYLHRGVGIQNKSIICLDRTFGEPCPVCQLSDELKEEDFEGNKKLIQKLWVQERQLFLLLVHGEGKKGLQLWDVAYGNFGKLLDKRLKKRREEEDPIEFHDPEDGQTLEVSLDEKSFEKNKYLSASHIDFVDRERAVPAKYFEDTPCLDEMLVKLPYEKVKSILHETGSSDDENEDDETPRRSSKKKASGRSSVDRNLRSSKKKGKSTKKGKATKKRQPVDDDDIPF